MAVGRPTFLSRLFEFPIRAACTEVAPLKWISIREQWLVHRSRFPKDDWHFSWCWPWVPLSIFVPPAAVLVRLRSRTGHERWYLERNISRVPTTFSKNKIAGIEERPRDKKPACRCKFHANLGFPWIPQLSPPRLGEIPRIAHKQRATIRGYTQLTLLLWNPIYTRYPFIIRYLFSSKRSILLRDK